MLTSATSNQLKTQKKIDIVDIHIYMNIGWVYCRNIFYGV